MRSYREPDAFEDALQVCAEGAGRVPKAVTSSHELHQLPRLKTPRILLVLAHFARQTDDNVSPNLRVQVGPRDVPYPDDQVRL